MDYRCSTPPRQIELGAVDLEISARPQSTSASRNLTIPPTGRNQWARNNGLLAFSLPDAGEGISPVPLPARAHCIPQSSPVTARPPPTPSEAAIAIAMQNIHPPSTDASSPVGARPQCQRYYSVCPLLLDFSVPLQGQDHGADQGTPLHGPVLVEGRAALRHYGHRHDRVLQV